MTLRMEKIGENELMAYVDGQLSDTDRAIVEAYLADNPEKAEQVAEWQRQSTDIAALFAHVADEPVPDRLDPHRLASAPKAANDNWFAGWRGIAAALILVVAGSAAGWFGNDAFAPGQSSSDLLIADAFSAHELFAAQQRHAVEVDASERLHLTSWLSASLDRRLVVPDSLPNGFTLVGGRLLPGRDSAAAQLMYTAGDRKVTLYLTPRSESDPLQNQFADAGDLDALYWANDAVTCTIVGDLTRVEMEEIASEVFKALSWRDDNYRRG